MKARIVMSKDSKSDFPSEESGPLVMNRVPYMTSSGHIRYTNKTRMKDLPIDFSSWVAIFDQESSKAPLWVIH